MGERDKYVSHWHDAAAWGFNSNIAAIGPKETELTALPSCLSTYGCGFLNYLPCPYFSGYNSGFVTSSQHKLGREVSDVVPNQFLILDCSVRANSCFPSKWLRVEPLGPAVEHQRNEMKVHYSRDRSVEDPSEIDVLLNSDSEETVSKLERKHGKRFPGEMDSTSFEESVASGGTGVVETQPAKKRKRTCRSDELLLVHTAASVTLDHNLAERTSDDGDAESCCIGDDEDAQVMTCTVEVDKDSTEDMNRRRDRIQEIVSTLRKILPDCVGKDAVAVLDEAICYLKHLKLKANVLRTNSF